MKACNDLDFLETYWIEAKKVGIKIKTELPKLATSNVNQNTGTLMYIVKFSDLKNSWSVEDILKKIAGESKTLEILANKINYMINKGRGKDVKPMIEKICTGRIKSLSKRPSKKELHKHGFYETNNKPISEYLGKGHFRWNDSAHTLNELEMQRLKNYFKL
jgi:hypothetical protein